MTNTELCRGGEHAGAQAAGWVVSVLLHCGLSVGALLFVQRVQLAPQSEPFRWNVALVSSDSPPIPSVGSSSSDPSPPVIPARPITPSITTRTQPAPPIPMTVIPTVPETVEPVDPVPTAPAVLVASPQPTEPIEHTPAAIGSMSPSDQTASIDTVMVPPQRESDSTRAVTSAHPESSTLTSSLTNTSPEPTASVTPQTPPPAETSVPAASSALQVAAITPPGSNRSVRIDYGWLSEVILRRVEELKRYPAEARVDRTEGKVVVKAVINEDGSVDDVEIFQSSGSTTLDKAAIDLMRRAAPFSLPHLLGKPRVTVKIPMNYRLDR